MRAVEGTADIDDVGAFVEALGAIGDRHGVTVQAFDARYVVDRAHLELAVQTNAARKSCERCSCRGFRNIALQNLASWRILEGQRQSNTHFSHHHQACPLFGLFAGRERG